MNLLQFIPRGSKGVLGLFSQLWRMKQDTVWIFNYFKTLPVCVKTDKNVMLEMMLQMAL